MVSPRFLMCCGLDLPHLPDHESFLEMHKALTPRLPGSLPTQRGFAAARGDRGTHNFSLSTAAFPELVESKLGGQCGRKKGT